MPSNNWYKLCVERVHQFSRIDFFFLGVFIFVSGNASISFQIIYNSLKDLLRRNYLFIFILKYNYYNIFWVLAELICIKLVNSSAEVFIATKMNTNWTISWVLNKLIYNLKKIHVSTIMLQYCINASKTRKRRSKFFSIFQPHSKKIKLKEPGNWGM